MANLNGRLRSGVGLMALAGLGACVDENVNTDQALRVAQAIDANASVVVRQVYGGGGNAGAALKHDFIELFNRGSTAQSLAGWSLQYASATGTGAFGANAAATTELPDVTLLPGQSFLVQEAPGAGGTALAAADLVDATPIALGASTGKVALVRSALSLGCNGGSIPCSDEQRAAIVDLVGFGSANFFEGAAPTAAPANATVVLRLQGGCRDTNDNGADFVVGAPELRTSRDALTPCTGEPFDAGVDAGSIVDPGSDAAAEGAQDAGPAVPGDVRIHDIQGAAHRSPLTGARVERVPGVVTVLANNGFYFEDLEPDADPATSEGLFVFTSSAPSVAVGDSVLVSGLVTEYRPGCSACAASSSAYNNLTTTELTSASVVRLESGRALPEAVALSSSGRSPPTSRIAEDAGGDVESVARRFSPADNGIDFYESLEGMRVRLPNARAVSPTRSFSGGSLELAVVTEGAGPLAARGAIVLGVNDTNPERSILSNSLGVSLPSVDVGARFDGTIEAVVDYDFANYKLRVSAPLPALVASPNVPEQTSLSAPRASELTVASFNVENLDPGDPVEKRDAIATRIVENLGAPDLLAIEEVQDNSGPTNDGVVDASRTLNELVAAIEAAGGPHYEYRQIDPVNGQDGGEPGGNIRVAFLFRTDRGLAFVERAGGTSSSANAVLGATSGAALAFSPGRIAPTSSAFQASRKPLAAEFTFRGRRLFAIANHFNSKGGDQPLFGRFQAPLLSSEAQRLAQAQIVADFVREISALEPDAHVLVLGDLNDFAFSRPLGVLKDAGLRALIETLPENERYSYVYDGNGQVLDHVLVSGALEEHLVGFDVVHINAEFVAQVSDHDPLLARFDFPTASGPACSPLARVLHLLSAHLPRAQTRLCERLSALPVVGPRLRELHCF